MTAAVAETGSLVGQTIGGKFAVEEHIGAGAMGDVYRATHIGLGRPVALKVMRTDLSDETFVARFQREARAASALDHPNTVRVLDFGTESSGLAYIAMELLNGRDLYDVIKREHPLAPERIVDLLSQALSAMKAAHRLGIIHRDIKPENIMVTVVPDEDGEPREIVKVCDFGIAKVIDSRGMQTEPGRALTGTGTLVGTPEYMSPEQSRGEPLDARSDLYSMGIVLFQMLTARVPFSSETPIGVVVKQVTDLPPKPSSWVPGIEPRLEEICLRALEKRPEDRFQTAGEMRAALRGIAETSMPLLAERMGSQASLPHLAVRQASSDGKLPAVRESDFGSRPTLLQGEPVLAGERAATPAPTPEEAPARKKKRRSLAPLLLAVLLLGGLLGGLIVVVPRYLGGQVPLPTPSASGPQGATDSHPSATTSQTIRDTPPKPSAGPGPLHATPTASGKKLPPLPPASASGKAPPLASASAAPSSPSSPASAEPPAPLVNADGAFVRVGHISTSPGAQGSVTAFMGRATPTLSSCYRAAVKGTQRAKDGVLMLSISLDDKGKVTSAIVLPGPLVTAFPELPRCFQGALTGQTVGPIDATTTADVQLALVLPRAP